ncbi:hypothetical protein CYMTET_18973 [Cymbomonas tetramitiformis]|uniref:Uncharacterized protein n=1 Tax=Cymbomonas tetramitiformis TaxID=36881 RepID=A0AAE0G8C9_9CHLO|nr:hypothetical protein CYMTET_18973 [Cymbomonas tetramitiformis]
MQNDGQQQWQQRGRGLTGMEESREAEDRRNMLTMMKEFAGMEPATLTSALEQFYLEKLEDVRLQYTNRAKGFPLEKARGALDEQGHIRYNLLQNCTTIDGRNLDKNGFQAEDFHITERPSRAHPPRAVEFLGHVETVLRILHGEGDDKKIICRKTPPRPRFMVGRVAGIDIKFTDTAYAVTALATTLPFIPLNCYPIGRDLFT